MEPSPLAGEGRVRGWLEGLLDAAPKSLSEYTGSKVNSAIMASRNARALRANQTEAESRLWQRLRDRQLAGVKFRRQAPVGPYIADFICLAAKLIVEIDGGQHAESAEADAARTAWLEGQGFRVLRFWNNDAMANTDGVLEEILAALRGG